MESALQQLEDIEQEALKGIADAEDAESLDRVRVEFLGKKGRLTRVLRGLAAVPAQDRPQIGQRVNEAKERLARAVDARKSAIREREREARLSGPQLDISLPGFGQPCGAIHVLSRTMAEICDILGGFGFCIAEGPDIEDEYHNFEALNIPEDHPARDMQDTFFVHGGRVLRTHTSPVQIRVMESLQPPLQIIARGSVYRHDDDVTHSPMFHQVEGLMVDEGVTFSHLKGVLTAFLQRIFERELPVRFRPSYFPFTEPSAEVDIGCVMCDGSGKADGVCRICKGSGWLEILGCGMVDPAVFAHVGYDSEKYTGFAFGLGVERIAMLKHRIGDIRLFYGSDLRFLKQF